MASIDPLLRRNKDFAASGAHTGASIVAKHPVYVITCLDPIGHVGSYFMAATERFLDGFLPWVVEEVL